MQRALQGNAAAGKVQKHQGIIRFKVRAAQLKHARMLPKRYRAMGDQRALQQAVVKILSLIKHQLVSFDALRRGVSLVRAHGKAKVLRIQIVNRVFYLYLVFT